MYAPSAMESPPSRLVSARPLLGFLHAGAPLLVALGASLGCAPTTPRTPEAALHQFAEAVDQKDWDRAYALLSDETRAQISPEEFRRQLLRHPGEAEEFAAQVQRSPAAVVSAQVTTPDGDQLNLVLQDGSWRIDESAIDFYSQKEPRLALGSFVRAYDFERYDVLLRFVPEDKLSGLSAETLKTSFQGEMKAEMEQIVEGIRANYLKASIEVLGEHAAMSYGSGAAVELILEDGVWKIEDFK